MTVEWQYSTWRMFRAEPNAALLQSVVVSRYVCVCVCVCVHV